MKSKIKTPQRRPTSRTYFPDLLLDLHDIKLECLNLAVDYHKHQGGSAPPKDIVNTAKVMFAFVGGVPPRTTKSRPKPKRR